MNLEELNAHFGLAGVLAFRQGAGGLIYADITAPAASARVYLQGAHLAAWQPKDQIPVIFMSRKSDMEAGKPIRGGVPIAFPWFAVDQKQDRLDGKPGPSHGFARLQDWTVAFAALAGEDLHLTMTLGPTEMSRKLGFDHFRLAFQLVLGRTLTMRLMVANDGDEPLVFEEALHTYFHVADVHEVSVSGLEPTSFIDKTDGMKVKPGAHAPLTFTGFTDRVYSNTAATCIIHDALAKRSITIEKAHSNTTVVFNPWRELPDMGPDEWHEMLCVETVNAGVNAITLEPGKTHTMEALVKVEAVKS
ncbi:D-hexose-6-phosphate mutarotase [Granulicella sp. dw_53]|uniref:D-hexose-6-phosphate mutarotase n=1 Tax=Granulicella sp. dw_53 TaxID=2719792 RepID=UPI001BD475F6|nr:D-hexose-6-phosphate mutarotase [Granulicella sp. dw_53]